MEITVDKLFAIIGNLYTELFMLRNEVQSLRQRLSDEMKEKGGETVTPLRPPMNS